MVYAWRENSDNLIIIGGIVCSTGLKGKMMMKITGKVSPLLRSGLLAAAALIVIQSTDLAQAAPGGGTGIAVVVNNAPITSGDIAKRAAFLRLQRQTGNLSSVAREQMIDEQLKRSEILRAQMSVSTSDVDAAFGRFAASNKMSVAQMSDILEKSGVTTAHFKAYIAVQMSWPRVVAAKYGSGRLSNQDLVARMMENGGKKPVTTEYFLQQIIFVIPESKRGAITAKRQQEANASRARFPGCDQSKVFAATMRDVSVRNLGRLMAPELPDEWKPLIEKAGNGNTTATRVTEKGVEFLAICKQRQVNDDVAAEMVFRAEDIGKQKNGEDPNSKKYLDELRKKAQITSR